MIFPLLIGIWFGVAAFRAGKNWVLWTVLGAAIAYGVGNAISFVWMLILGPLTVDTVATFAVLSMASAVVATVAIGLAITGKFSRSHREASSADTTSGGFLQDSSPAQDFSTTEGKGL